MLLASQNLEDFDQEGIREMTKPLFSIPPHQFLFNAGSIDKRSYMEMLQLDEAEYNLIKFPQRGVCLYKCGNERYLLEVHAPSYKEKAVWHGGWSLMAVSAGMIAKAAATVLSNEKLRKGVDGRWSQFSRRSLCSSHFCVPLAPEVRITTIRQ